MPRTILYTGRNIGSVGIRFGSNYLGTASYYNGYMDDIAMWNRVLNDSEILAIYNTGGPLVKK